MFCNIITNNQCIGIVNKVTTTIGKTKKLSSSTTTLCKKNNRIYNNRKQYFSSSSSSSSKKKKYRNLIENAGSTARDHLANERTFLAWARTGMGFVALGVAIDSIQNQSLLHDPSSSVTSNIKVIKVNQSKDITIDEHNKTNHDDILTIHLPAFGCIATGGVMLAHATNRYYSVQKALLKGKFMLGTNNVFGIIFVTSILTIGSLGLVFSNYDTLEIIRSGTITTKGMTNKEQKKG